MCDKPKLLSLRRQKIEGLVFFVMFYLYLWLVVDLRFVPNLGGIITRFPLFYRDWIFFYKTCAIPGGPVDYLSSFLVQFFYYGWAGAIIVTLQVFLIYFCTRKFLDSFKMSSFFLVPFSCPVIILILYNKYFYFFDIASGFLIALVFTNLYVVLTQETKMRAPSLLVFLILSVILYPIAGGGILMFVILCMIYELIGRSRPVVAGTELLLAFVVAFVIGVGIYHIDTIEDFGRLLPIPSNFNFYMGSTTIACCLYFFLPIIILFLLLIKKIPRPDFFSTNHQCRISSYTAKVQFLILLTLASLAVYFSYDMRKRNVYAVDFYANQRNWSKALRTAELEVQNPFMLFMLNRALYHSGRLPQDMFLYPQQSAALFYATFASLDNFSGLYQGTDLFIDLGLVNYAEHHAWQKIETFGPLPELLKRVAIIRMAKGNMDSARVYLNTLSQTLFHSYWSKGYLEKLKSDPTLSSDDYIQSLRRNMIKMDHVMGKGGAYWALTKLLEENRYNKMAFEYLMAMYLLHKDPKGVVKNLHRLPDFGYTETPQPYEEAFLLRLMQVYPKNVNVPQTFRVSAESKERFKAFSKFMRKYGEDKYAVEREVTTYYKHTYYEYFFYGFKYNGGEK